MTDNKDSESPSDAVHAVMVEIHQDFLRFLTRRLGNEDEAADVSSRFLRQGAHTDRRRS